jgi:cytochrome o ubiquinol oxidase subunit 1
MKRTGRAPGGPIGVEPAYENIEMPRNSPVGFITAFFAVIMGFALIWQIWWMAIVGALAAAITALIAGWSDEREHEISAAEIARMERARLGT